jgi:hypothetical protein
MKYSEIIQAINDGLARLDAAISEHSAEITRLEDEGMINAKEYWRNDKYLYLIYPQRSGERTREYIGADPEKIAAAQKKLANYTRWHDVQAEKVDLERQMRYALQKLQEVKQDVQPH